MHNLIFFHFPKKYFSALNGKDGRKILTLVVFGSGIKEFPKAQTK
jgi:hypothetical protein